VRRKHGPGRPPESSTAFAASPRHTRPTLYRTSDLTTVRSALPNAATGPAAPFARRTLLFRITRLGKVLRLPHAIQVKRCSAARARPLSSGGKHPIMGATRVRWLSVLPAPPSSAYSSAGLSLV
jgi:hypothetical protein